MLVPVVCLGAGLLFATSATVAQGTDLRSSGTRGLVGLVRGAQSQVGRDEDTLSRLDAQVRAATDDAGAADAGVGQANRRASGLKVPAGLSAMAGPGLTVTLDDASDPPAAAGIDPNDTVVHQSDLQAVVNALWAGGAEAMSIAGQRVISTSAVRCVGNTLLLNGRVYSPPFAVTALGPAAPMRAALDRSPGVRLYRQAVDALGLLYRVESSPGLRVPPYDAVPVVSSARVLR
ncbi:MAG: DUF881 domain-containing protein [bacterium]